MTAAAAAVAAVSTAGSRRCCNRTFPIPLSACSSCLACLPASCISLLPAAASPAVSWTSTAAPTPPGPPRPTATCWPGASTTMASWRCRVGGLGWAGPRPGLGWAESGHCSAVWTCCTSPPRLLLTTRAPAALVPAGQAPVYAPTLVKALEGQEPALVRSGQHHTLVLTRAGAHAPACLHAWLDGAAAGASVPCPAGSARGSRRVPGSQQRLACR